MPPLPSVDPSASRPGPLVALRRFGAWLRLFSPPPLGIDRRERLRMAVGTALCIALVALCAHGLE